MRSASSTSLILRDDAFGMIRWKQENMNFPDYGMALANLDWVDYAKSYAARGHRITSAAEFAPLVRKCFLTPGVHVIDVPIDYSDNERLRTAKSSGCPLNCERTGRCAESMKSPADDYPRGLHEMFGGLLPGIPIR